MSALSSKFSEVANLYEILSCYWSPISTFISFLRLYSSTKNFSAASLLTDILSLTFETPQTDSAYYHSNLRSKIERHVYLNAISWSVWLWVPMGRGSSALANVSMRGPCATDIWILRCGGIYYSDTIVFNNFHVNCNSVLSVWKYLYSLIWHWNNIIFRWYWQLMEHLF
jgi:hypothetical protein